MVEGATQVGDTEETLPLGLPRVGDLVAGRYRIEHELGAGAMGIVHAARDVTTNTAVALKLLRSPRKSRTSAARFLQEIRRTRALRSPYVVRVLDEGVLDVGHPYFVMELLAGETMLERLRAHGPLPIDEVIDAVTEACAAMDEAHARGIVHRDLKPANLLRTLDAEGRPTIKVLDFGISKSMKGKGQPTVDPELTDTTDLLGSPIYASPEQLRSAKRVDHRTDLWSLGVVMHRLLTSEPPFAGKSMTALCAAVMAEDPIAPSVSRPEVPGALDAIVARCLRKAPDDRFESAASLARALLPFGGERAHRAVAIIDQAVAKREARRRARLVDPMAGTSSRGRVVGLAWFAAAVLLAAVIVALTILRGERRQSSTPGTTNTPAAGKSGTPARSLPSTKSSKPWGSIDDRM